MTKPPPKDPKSTALWILLLFVVTALIVAFMTMAAGCKAMDAPERHPLPSHASELIVPRCEERTQKQVNNDVTCVRRSRDGKVWELHTHGTVKNIPITECGKSVTGPLPCTYPAEFGRHDTQHRMVIVHTGDVR